MQPHADVAVQENMQPADQQQVESIIAHQVAEAERLFHTMLDQQAFAIVSLAFWEVLLVKPHRCAAPPPCPASTAVSAPPPSGSVWVC